MQISFYSCLFRASKIGSISIGRPPQPHVDPNQDAFDDDVEELNSNNTNAAAAAAVPSNSSDMNEEDVDIQMESSDSSEEEDLESPAVIRQQRSIQRPTLLIPTNGGQVSAPVKPVDTCK